MKIHFVKRRPQWRGSSWYKVLRTPTYSFWSDTKFVGLRFGVRGIWVELGIKK